MVFRHHRAAARRPPKMVAAEPNTQTNSNYLPPKKICDLKDRAVRESSGLAPSRRNTGAYWTNNDSGDGPFIYAFDETGARLGVWRVTGAKAGDWESIAIGPGPDASKSYLFVGDIGDNDEARSVVKIYRVEEPAITAADAQSNKGQPSTTAQAEIFSLRYPDGGHDAEALLVHPTTGNLYIVTKVAFGNPGVYLAERPSASPGPLMMKKLGEVQIPSMFGGIITDGAISPDGTRVILCDYLRGYEFTLEQGTTDFDSIWKKVPDPVRLGDRKQGEAVTYRLDGRALMATSEGLPTPLIQVSRR